MSFMLKSISVMGLVLAAQPAVYAKEPRKESKFKDLNFQTAHGFRVPYTLRYNPKDWKCEHWGEGQEFQSLKNRYLKIYISADAKDVNLTQEALDRQFQEHVKNVHSDPALYSNYEISPSEFVMMNGIKFLHQKEVVNLAPQNIRMRATGQFASQKKYTSESISKDQMDFYVYTGEKGSIYFCIESEGLVSQSDQESIDELFKGFSFDGSARRGPKGLRALKSTLDFLSNQ